MNTELSIAVVVLNWNGKSLLKQFLPNLIQYTPEAKIYVADNASTDHSILFVRENFDTINIIQNNGNLGFAEGYNQALAQIKADYYVLVNSDIEVTQNWLSPIINCFVENEKVGIIQPKILDFKSPKYFEYAGACGGYRDALGYAFCRGRIFNSVEKDLNQYNNTVYDLQWASGACLAIKADLFHQLNGFDSDFFAHQEEIDLCWRAQHLGIQIACTPSSVVYHVGGGSLAYQNPKKTFLNFRNSLLMILKNTPTKIVFPILFIRMVLDGLAALQYVSKGQFKHFGMVLKAHFSFYSLFVKTFKKRKTHTNKTFDYRTKSIVWKYYAQKKQSFKDL